MKITGNKMSGIKVKLYGERVLGRNWKDRMNITGNQMSGIKVKVDTERSIRQELERQNEDYRLSNVWYQGKTGY